MAVDQRAAFVVSPCCVGESVDYLIMPPESFAGGGTALLLLKSVECVKEFVFLDWLV